MEMVVRNSYSKEVIRENRKKRICEVHAWHIGGGETGEGDDDNDTR